jgi:hypothetical protein
MQGICTFEQRKERERETYTSSSGSNSPWILIRLQYEWVQVLYSLFWKMHCIKSGRRVVIPYRNQDMISGKLAEDNNLEILSEGQRLTRWIDFTPEINLHQYEKVHVGNGEHYILRSNLAQDVNMKTDGGHWSTIQMENAQDRHQASIFEWRNWG